MKDKAAIISALEYAPSYLAFQQTYMPYVGAQVAVRYQGELLLTEAFGFADLSAKTPLTARHLFRIASHSKTFTGTACLQLQEQGKLRLDDRAGDHIRELDQHSIGDVTVRDLLGHLSGMTRDSNDSSWWALNKPFPDRAELLKTITREGKVLDSLEHYKYSNIGYSLLGLIIEAASGRPYREYVATNIIDRLGLKDIGPDIDMDRIDDYAKGYSSRVHGPNRVEIEHIDTFAQSSATGFYSTAEDLTAYFQAHLDGDDRLLSDLSKRRMRQVQWTVTPDSAYGLGMGVSTVNGRRYYGHSGGYPGHITISRLDLERKLSISVLTNNADGPAASLCDAILKLIDLALARETLTKERKAKDLAPFEGRFATLWGVIDMVNLGGHLYGLNPTLLDPAGQAVEFDVLSDNELTPIGDKGNGGFGEVMRYTFRKNGSVKKIKGESGATLVPIEDFSLPEKVVRPY